MARTALLNAFATLPRLAIGPAQQGLKPASLQQLPRAFFATDGLPEPEKEVRGRGWRRLRFNQQDEQLAEGAAGHQDNAVCLNVHKPSPELLT